MEDVTLEPLRVIEGDIEREMSSFLFPDPNVTKLSDGFSIKLVRRCYFCLTGVQDPKSIVVSLWIGSVIVGTDAHVKVSLMCGPLDVKHWGLTDDVHEKFGLGVDEEQLSAFDVHGIYGQNQVLKVQFLVDSVGVVPEGVDDNDIVESDDVKQSVRG